MLTKKRVQFSVLADVQGEDGPGVAEPGVGAVAVEMAGPCASSEPPGGGAVGAHYRGPEHHGAHVSASQGEGNLTEGGSLLLSPLLLRFYRRRWYMFRRRLPGTRGVTYSFAARVVRSEKCLLRWHRVAHAQFRLALERLRRGAITPLYY